MRVGLKLPLAPHPASTLIIVDPDFLVSTVHENIKTNATVAFRRGCEPSQFPAKIMGPEVRNHDILGFTCITLHVLKKSPDDDHDFIIFESRKATKFNLNIGGIWAF